MARFLFYDDKLINILLQEEKPSGGATVQAYGWIRGLSDTGQDVRVITNLNQKGPLKKECKDLKLVPLYDRQKGIRWLRWLYYRLPYIYKKIKQNKPDYLYQGIPGWTSFVFGLICRQLKIKYVLRISSDILLDDRFYKNPSKANKLFQRMGLKLAHCILCQNDYQLSIIKKEFPNKLAIKIPNPIFKGNVEYSNNKDSKQYIAWLGLFRYPKNLKLLYEIASILKEEQFAIAGTETTKVDEETFIYVNKLRQLANVKFIGFLHRQEVLPFLAKAKFLLNTSRYEGFSNTFLEAMSVGTPILTSENVNPDSIITRFNLGIVYKDAADLNTQYSSITPEAYNKMVDNSQDYVVEHHEYKTLATKLVDFLNKK